MPSHFSKLSLQHLPLPTKGIKILSPLSGRVGQIDEQQDALAAAGFYGEGVTITTTTPILVAPYPGLCVRHDEIGTCVSFIHANGLRMDVRLSEQFLAHGLGLNWQLPAKTKVTVGQAILHFDPLLLHNGKEALSFIVTLQDHTQFHRIVSALREVDAGQDVLFVIELKST